MEGAEPPTNEVGYGRPQATNVKVPAFTTDARPRANGSGQS